MATDVIMHDSVARLVEAGDAVQILRVLHARQQ